MLKRLSIGLRAWLTRRQRAHVGVGASLLIALLTVPLILACGARPVTIATAPASDLALKVTFTDEYIPSPMVAITAWLLLATQSGPYLLSTAHTLTCDGVAVPISGIKRAVPRQPPGGAYTFVYTDERGQRTTLVVPVPRGTLTITAPTANARIPIPRLPSYAATPTGGTAHDASGAGAMSVVSVPTTPTPVGQTRDPSLVSQPPITIDYSSPVLPANATATAQGSAYWWGYTGRESFLNGPTILATGTYTLSDARVPLGYGFETAASGAGGLTVNYAMVWPLPPGGFRAAQVTYDGQASVGITWTY